MGTSAIFDFVLAIVGYVYPAYASFKAIQDFSRRKGSTWMIYWLVYGLFRILIFVSDLYLGWVPFYNCAKLVVNVLLLPDCRYNWSRLIFKRVLYPVFICCERGININSRIIKRNLKRKFFVIKIGLLWLLALMRGETELMWENVDLLELDVEDEVMNMQVENDGYKTDYDPQEEVDLSDAD